ncbi:MAG: bifunctional [glutamate--ammonia ligase]-adenylyl-L-tyrosine phosphorylase/[glutamate--ammonia-ligase] adenylyltransferase [Pirellulaceae bacterium]
MPEIWLATAAIRDIPKGLNNLTRLLKCQMTDDLLESVLDQLAKTLPVVSDPDMAFNNFERFVSAARSRLALGALFDREPTAILVLLRIFSNSQYLADLLIRDTEAYDALQMSEGQPIAYSDLYDDLSQEMRSATESRQAMAILRRFKQRETLRIAFGDVIAQQRLNVVTEQISVVAQTICQCAYEFVRKQLVEKWGDAVDSKGNPIPFVIFALGKFGGIELNYSSDIDLILVFGETGKCDGPRYRSAQEFFEDLARDFTKLLNETTGHGICYRVDHRLRPDGSKGRLVNSRRSLTQYLENSGRTWERQAWIKARPVAGSLEFGRSILRELNGWIYRSHLNRFDITGVKALKRQIEKRTEAEGREHVDIKTGHGGIRDIEFVTQFLQLLYGGRLPELQTVNTLQAVEHLQQTGCLSLNEETLLAQNYIWLRRLEHRLQIMFDLQTHSLPESESELRKIAIRMGYGELFDVSPLQQFQNDLRDITDVNRRILEHLMHSAFTEADLETVPPIVDLAFKQEPTDDEKRAALSDLPFSNPLAAANNFISCATETIPFLSHQRCRHFFAAIAPKLVREISNTPDPDGTLISLRSVADNLGAKGVLWELFSVSPPSMELFVRLCASADYLTSILRTNPGMIDELVDALLVESIAPKAWLRTNLNSLLKGATDIDPIVHSFKQSQHLRVGVQELMGAVDQRTVSRALSDIADICLETVAKYCFKNTARRLGVPQVENDSGGSECRYAIVACGKLGGAELNYQSDLDLIFLYEADGHTRSIDPNKKTTNQHFFSEWAAEITKVVTTSGRFGKLYEIDSRLRPSGKSGTLATSLDALKRYFHSGSGATWERLVLCKSRIVVAESDFIPIADAAIRSCILEGGFDSNVVLQIREMRSRMAKDVPDDNLKRSEGGTVDIEFLTQLLQMKYLSEFPELRIAQTVDSLRQQTQLKLISNSDQQHLVEGYRFLRAVENAIRLTSSSPRSELGSDSAFIRKIAYAMKLQDSEDLQNRIKSNKSMIHRIYERVTLDLIEGLSN